MKTAVIFLIFSMTVTSVLFGHGRASIPSEDEARRITFLDTAQYLTILMIQTPAKMYYQMVTDHKLGLISNIPMVMSLTRFY